MLKALICDVDGTITDPQRRVNTLAIDVIRDLTAHGVEVVLASGNTACFMDALCRAIGTSGSFIAENGGVYRIGYDAPLHLDGDQAPCWEAYRVLDAYYHAKGVTLQLYSDRYRFTDLAFARTVPADEVQTVVGGSPVRVIDTGYAIHLQVPGVNKGTAFERLAADLGISMGEFLALGDSMNDIEMLKKAGKGVAVANAHPATKNVADWVTEGKYGEGFVEAIKKYHAIFSTDTGQPQYSL